MGLGLMAHADFNLEWGRVFHPLGRPLFIHVAVPAGGKRFSRPHSIWIRISAAARITGTSSSSALIPLLDTSYTSTYNEIYFPAPIPDDTLLVLPGAALGVAGNENESGYHHGFKCGRE